MWHFRLSRSLKNLGTGGNGERTDWLQGFWNRTGEQGEEAGNSTIDHADFYSLCFFFFFLIAPSFKLEKAMATHPSTLASKIPWMEEPGRLQSMGSRRGGHTTSGMFHSWNSSHLCFIICGNRFLS